MSAIGFFVQLMLMGSPTLIPMMIGFFGVQRFAIDASASKSWCVASLLVLAVGIGLIALALKGSSHQDPMIFPFVGAVSIAAISLGALNFVLMRLSREYGFWIAIVLTLMALFVFGALAAVVLWTAQHG